MALPTYTTALSQINTFIIANGNNEITANVLNPVLRVILDFANNNIGDLYTLTTDEKNSIVEAINSLKQNFEDLVNNGVQLYTGIDNPNTTPPPTFKYADFYMQIDVDELPVKLWQWNGFVWTDSSDEAATESDNVNNNSDVPGVKVTDALNYLNNNSEDFLNKTDFIHQSENFLTINPSSTITPTPSTYDAFPLLLKCISGKVLLFSRNATNHGSSEGTIQMRSSLDGGFTFSAPVSVLSQSGVDCRNVSGGVTSTGRIVLTIFKYDPINLLPISMGYMFSDDEGATFTPYTILSTSPEPNGSPFGKLVSIGNDEVLQSWYVQTGTPYGVYIRKSLDNGATWQPSILVATSPTVSYTEASFAYLGGSSILAICRVSSPNVFVQFKSVDNGATWSNMGSISFESGFQVSPELTVFTDVNNEKWVNLFYANRTSNTLNVVTGKASDLLNSVSGWVTSSKTTIDTNPNIDFGYPSVVSGDLSKFYNVAYYKASVPNANASLYFKTGTTYPNNLSGSGTINAVPKYITNSTLGNSNISDTGSAVTVNSSLAVNSNISNSTAITTAYSTAFATSTVPDSNRWVNLGNTDGVAGLATYYSSRVGGSTAAVYLGVLNNNTNFNSIFVFGRRTGSASWAESGRFGLDGGFSVGNQTSLGTGTGNFTGTVTAATPTLATHLATKGYVDGLIRPYKSYAVAITQASTSAPSVVIMENAIGAIVWTRAGTGTYVGTLTGAFTVGKTIILQGTKTDKFVTVDATNANQITINSKDKTGTNVDGLLIGDYLEIRVYN